MALVDSDRNLLFGLLALQNGLIDQGALFAAFAAWTRDKGRPLADHLVDLGHLDAPRRAAVEAIAGLHVQALGGDPGKSLAVLAVGRSTRESLVRAGGPDVAATLGHVASADLSTFDDADRTASCSVGAATSDGQRFRLLRPHARGGLGEVFVALDAELRREVALKQILEKHADDLASRQRFVAEAEITGALEHPGVVPVYGLGTYSRGRPYYAMRFIKGDSLKEAIEHFHADQSLKHSPGRQSLELRRLLRRFLDVCNAIDYAHSRGVIHRDLKPANIIVGKHGETLVVDWGLAKSVGRADPSAGEQTIAPSSSGSSETLPGSALGTPAYMSPEQASGDLDRVGRRSDVYSLGATLYCLLTGKPPFEGDDIGAILRKVQQGAFVRPTQLDPALDKALDAVCSKAMATQPEDRYPTPKALADDLDRWMADEPVAAWREPWSWRARRWARRNRTAVATAAATVLVALAATATVLGVQTRANGALRAANARTLAERDLAQQNFKLARQAVDDYLTRVGQNPLLKERGLHDLRQDLLESALGYYRDFLRQRGDDPNLLADAAAAHGRVGEILIELGRFNESQAAYEQALTLIEPLVRARPGDPTTATAQIRLETGRLEALKDGGRYQEAIVASSQTSRLGEALLAADAGLENLPNILARTHLFAALALKATGRFDEALGAATRAHQLAERATREVPGELSATRTRLYVTAITADLLMGKGRHAEGRRVCEQDIAFGKARLREHPRDVEIQINLANLEGALGEIEKSLGHPIEALSYKTSSTETLGALARANPLLVRVRAIWGVGLLNLSQLNADLGRYVDAERSAHSSIEVLEAVAREAPSNPYYRLKVGWAYGSLGKALLKSGSQAESLASLRKAVSMLETSDEPWDLYNMACALALVSTVADPAEGSSATARQRRDADRAVATIARAVALGLVDFNIWKNDPDFNSLRARHDFQALLMDLAFPADPFIR
jgi:eukaryotic-like serine/threonine-protein kinase